MERNRIGCYRLSTRGAARRGVTSCLGLGFLLTVAATPVNAQNGGEAMFKQSCAVCHTIGGGRLVGPDLSGVTERRQEAWLLSFIQSSQKVIASGDPIAVQLYGEFNQMPMPDHQYSAAQVREILDYIRLQGGSEPATEWTPMASQPVAKADSAEAVRRGRDLFVGRIRLEQGGAACNGCHTVDVAGVTTGGALARDLTGAYSRLSEAGLRAVVSNPPFPAMAAAIANAPTDEETSNLIAFLRAVEHDAASQPGRNYAQLLLLSGLGGFVALLVLTGASWYGRTRREVNRDIYMRQISSI